MDVIDTTAFKIDGKHGYQHKLHLGLFSHFLGLLNSEPQINAVVIIQGHSGTQRHRLDRFSLCCCVLTRRLECILIILPFICIDIWLGLCLMQLAFGNELPLVIVAALQLCQHAL